MKKCTNINHFGQRFVVLVEERLLDLNHINLGTRNNDAKKSLVISAGPLKCAIEIILRRYLKISSENLYNERAIVPRIVNMKGYLSNLMHVLTSYKHLC